MITIATEDAQPCGVTLNGHPCIGHEDGEHDCAFLIGDVIYGDVPSSMDCEPCNWESAHDDRLPCNLPPGHVGEHESEDWTLEDYLRAERVAGLVLDWEDALGHYDY